MLEDVGGSLGSPGLGGMEVSRCEIIGVRLAIRILLVSIIAEEVVTILLVTIWFVLGPLESN